jgi:hypothetical protein
VSQLDIPRIVSCGNLAGNQQITAAPRDPMIGLVIGLALARVLRMPRRDFPSAFSNAPLFVQN